MSTIIALGKSYPCVSQGINVDLQQTEPRAGDVVEFYFDSPVDISYDNAARIIWDIQKQKEQYPHSLIHYIKIDTHRITIQYSIAPVGAEGSPFIWWEIIAVIAAIIIAYLLITRVQRGYLWSPPPPVGTAIITAEDANTKLGLHNVPIYMDGNLEGKTDGGSITIKNILQGDHKFSGANLSGYQTPDIVTATIVKDQVKNITIWYYPVGSPKPTTGILEVYTDPPGGEVYIDTIDKGPSPISLEVAIGLHSVGFGPLEGYITPIVQTVTVSGPEPVVVTGKYILPGAPWWQSLIKWTAIGLTATAAAAILIPRIAKAARQKGEGA